MDSRKNKKLKSPIIDKNYEFNAPKFYDFNKLIEKKSLYDDSESDDDLNSSVNDSIWFCK